MTPPKYIGRDGRKYSPSSSCKRAHSKNGDMLASLAKIHVARSRALQAKYSCESGVKMKELEVRLKESEEEMS